MCRSAVKMKEIEARAGGTARSERLKKTSKTTVQKRYVAADPDAVKSRTADGPPENLRIEHQPLESINVLTEVGHDFQPMLLELYHLFQDDESLLEVKQHPNPRQE